MQQLPAPHIVRCYFETRFQPHLPAMELRWDPDAPGVADRPWFLPDDVCVKGPAPGRFGLTLHRHGDNSYQLRVLWNRLCLSWENLPRTEVMASSLPLILNALGTDLWYLLNQPIDTALAHVGAA
jgi:hypothetical protein